jgi:hypothetical protein
MDGQHTIIRRAAFAAVSALLLLAACGGDDGDTSATTEPVEVTDSDSPAAETGDLSELCPTFDQVQDAIGYARPLTGLDTDDRRDGEVRCTYTVDGQDEPSPAVELLVERPVDAAALDGLAEQRAGFEATPVPDLGDEAWSSISPTVAMRAGGYLVSFSERHLIGGGEQRVAPLIEMFRTLILPEIEG